MTYQCACCGYRSETEDFFRTERVGLLRRNRSVCAGCRPPKDMDGKLQRYMISVAIVFALGTGLLALHDSAGAGVGVLMIGMGFFYLSFPFTAAVHEAGHAVFGAAAGMRISKIQVGFGPLLFAFPIGPTRVEARLDFRAGGFVHGFSSTEVTARWRKATFLIGGILANLAVGALLFCLLGVIAARLSPHPVVLIALFGAGVSQILTGLMNLIPRTFKRPSGDTVSDGRRLLGLFKNSSNLPGGAWAESFVEAQALYEARRFDVAETRLAAALERHDNAPRLLVMFMGVLSHTKGARAAWTAFEDRALTLQTGPTDEIGVALVKLEAAWQALLTEDAALLPRAVDLSEDAMTTIGSLPAARAVRGAALIASERPAAGVELLWSAAREVDDPEVKGKLCAYLARAEREISVASLEPDFLALSAYLAAKASATPYPTRLRSRPSAS